MHCSANGFLLIIVLAASVLLHGCTSTPLQPEKPISAEKAIEILGKLKAREERILHLKGLFHVSITGSILPISRSMPGVVFYTRPDSIRLKGLTPVGGTFFQFVRDGEDYELLMPGNGQSAAGKIHELRRVGDIGQVVELSLHALDAVLGKIQGLTPVFARLFEEQDVFRIDIPTVPGQHAGTNSVSLTRLRVDKVRSDIMQIEYLGRDGEVLRSIDCQDFRAVSTQSLSPDVTPIYLPFHIHAEDDQLSGSVTLDFQELVINSA